MVQSNFDVFQVVADPSRRTILQLLTKNSLSINALADHFEMSRPAVSKHIKILNDSGFIDIENIGRERYCTLNKAGFDELNEWINYFDLFWASKLKKLGQVMKKREDKRGKRRV